MYIKYVLFFMATIIIGPAFSQQASKNENIVSDKVKEIEIDANAPPLTEAGCFSIRGIHNFSSLHDQIAKASKTAVAITIHPQAKIGIDKFRAQKKSLFKVVVSLKSID